MSDITTVEEVSAGDYTVRVAQTDDGSAWEAVVINHGDSGGPRLKGGPGMLFSVGYDGPKSDDETPVGPPVTAPHRWVAIGFAIEAYEWDGMETDPVDMETGYSTAEIGEMGTGEMLRSMMEDG